MPCVDIVVPCYNYAHYLESCVASILSQRDVDVRVLIINDCSPDQTDQIGTALAASDPRVDYLKNAQNLGLIGTANRGLLEWASADYALLLSADDLLTPGSLARACAVMEQHKHVHLVYGRALLIGDDYDPATLPPDSGDADSMLIDGAAFIQRNFTHFNPVPSPTAVVRTRVQKELGGYLPQFPHTSDMEMWMRFAARGPIGGVDTLQAGYRIHGSSMSAPKLRRAISDREECFQTCTYIVETECQDLPEAGDWLAQMRRRLVAEAYWCATQPQYSPDQRQACVAFAARIDDKISMPRLKYEIKKYLKAFLPKSTANEDPVYFRSSSNIYGWLPGDE